VNTVLVVGGKPEQANALAASLGILGVEAIASARDVRLAVRSLVAHRISLIVLDIDSSAQSREFFVTLHELTDLPIMARGATADTDQIISYLELGAVDYIGKSTPPTVLAAKIQSQLRSVAAGLPASPGVVHAGELTIDLHSRTVLKGAEEVALTPLEYRLLSVLAQNVGKACAREELLEKVWGRDFTNCAHYLRLYIGYLRQKLEQEPSRPRLLMNEWGYGYRLIDPGLVVKRRRVPSLRFALPG